MKTIFLLNWKTWLTSGERGEGDELTPRPSGGVAHEKNMVFEEFKGRAGDILSGTVRRFERSDVIIDLGKIEGVDPSFSKRHPGVRQRTHMIIPMHAIGNLG